MPRLASAACRYQIAVAFGRRIVNHAAPCRLPAKIRDFEKTMRHSLFNPRRMPAALLALLILVLAGCATPPTDPAARAEFDETNDPFEPLNRKIFAVNLFFDRILLRPIAVTYQASVPEVARNGVRHFLDNLSEPVVFANNLLQGEFKRAHDTAGRFLMNSTFGLGGTMDLATSAGLEKQTGDFGQTLYYWGAPEGPYLVLPILGPSNPRDGIGIGVDGYADPYSHFISGNAFTNADYGRYAVNGIDQRARNIQTLDELQRNAIDFYSQLRSLFRQHRASELRHGEPAPLPDLDTLYRDPDPPAEPQISQTKPG